MFAVEIYVSILENLSLADLEAVQFVDVNSPDVVEKGFAKDGPTRLFLTLHIHGHEAMR
ncbi:hypothetical protein AAVH_27048, partial [Aphelenchoides avenae]